MAKAADSVKKQAVDSLKVGTKHNKEIELDPVAMGIPPEVVEALSDENLVRVIRQQLEALAAPAGKNATIDEKAKSEVLQRVSKAANNAMNDPIVDMSMERAADDLAVKEAKKV